MFSQKAIQSAKKQVTEKSKIYLVSDGSFYSIKRDQDISELVKHWTKNKLKVYDVEEGKELELKKTEK